MSNMLEDTNIEIMEEDLVKTPAEVVNVAEVSVVPSKKKRKRKKTKRKKKKNGDIAIPEGGNICQLQQDTPLDVEMPMDKLQVPIITNVDSTTMVLAVKKKRKKKKKKNGDIAIPESANICQLQQDTPLDVEMPMDKLQVPIITNVDSTTMPLTNKRKKKKKNGDIAIPESGTICQLQQHTPLDVEMPMDKLQVPVITDVDSTTLPLTIKRKRKKKKKNGDIAIPESGIICQLQQVTPLDEVANQQQLLAAVPFHLLPEKVRFVFPRRKLLILDLNGLLADIILPAPRDCKPDIKISGRAVFKRPFYYDFLKFCFERFDVAVWSSRSKKIVDRMVDYLFGGLKHKLLFCWDMFHCTRTSFKTLENRHKPLVFKELRKLWEKHYDNLPWESGNYNESNTLLLDDSPYKALLNPMNTSVFPFTFSYKDTGDKSLGAGGDLRVYLEELAKADNVQTYVQQHPFGQCPINEKSSVWSFYCTVLSGNQG